MSDNRQSLTGGAPSKPANSALVMGGLAFALVFPSLVTWAYAVLASGSSGGAQKSVFAVLKCIQFLFPIVWVGLVLREPVRTGRASWKGLGLGAAFSVIVVGAGWLLFEFVLRGLPIFGQASALIGQKIAAYGITSPARYAILAVFYCGIHSLLEEYYWRWFVFRQLRKLVPLWPAIVVSALAFMAHHVIVLSIFFKQAQWLAWLLSSAVAVGGAFWAWLYERTGSIFGPWLSHLLIDAGIFWIGFELIRATLGH